MTIKTVIFDFGGVIYQLPDLKGIIKIQEMLGITFEPEIFELLKNPEESSLIQGICLGEVPEDQIWVMIVEKWGAGPRMLRYLRRKFVSRRSLNKPLANFIKKLSQDYTMGILSNAGDRTRSIMEDIFHLDRYVDEIIISAEEKLVKPDERIYQVAMDRLGAEPETSLFVDDLLVNVQAARDFGMKAIQFISNEQTIQDVMSCLDLEA